MTLLPPDDAPEPGRMGRYVNRLNAEAAASARALAVARCTRPGAIIPETGQTWEGRARLAWARAMSGGLLDRLDRLALDKYPEPLGVDGVTPRPRLERDVGGDWRPPPTRPRSHTPPGPPPPSPFDRGMAGSELAGRAKWTPDEREQVTRAIAAVALRMPTFTADDVWQHLAGAVPVTKGLAARLTAAVREGLIVNTGETRIADRGGPTDHAQRLTIWRSLVCET